MRTTAAECRRNEAVRTHRFAPVLVVLLALLACGAPRVRHPPYVQHPTSALVEVPYPAPPPLVEVIPEIDDERAVWIDGEWRFSRRQWRWQRGYWTLAPAGLAFSPPVEVRGEGGTLWVAPGTWRDARGAAVPDPDALARARGNPISSVKNASGEREAVGRSPVNRPTTNQAPRRP